MTLMVFEIQKRESRTFKPISFDDYVARHLAANKDEKETDFRERLRHAVESKRAGQRCDCGEPIWAIGSAETGYSCFTCTTGESDPSEDFEIDMAVAPGTPTVEEMNRCLAEFKPLIKRVKTLLWEESQGKRRQWSHEYAFAMEIYEVVKGDAKRWPILNDASDSRVLDWLIPLPLNLAGAGLVQEAARLSLAWAEITEADNFLPDRAVLLAEAGLEQEARQQIRANIERFPKDAWVHIKAGAALRELKDLTGAEAYFRNGLELADKDYDREGALDYLIPLLRESGRVTEAADLEAAEQKRLREDEDDADVDIAHLPGSFDDEPLATQVAKVGRNDPCPCGSGKKYKKCCLDASVPAAATE